MMVGAQKISYLKRCWVGLRGLYYGKQTFYKNCHFCEGQVELLLVYNGTGEVNVTSDVFFKAPDCCRSPQFCLNMAARRLQEDIEKEKV